MRRHPMIHRWTEEDGQAGMHRLAPCYLGHRSRDGCTVVCHPQAVALPVRLDVQNHSPDGFEWGYGGSGPAQLALALLCHVTGDEGIALALHQRFKFQVIGSMQDLTSWLIYRDDIARWVNTEGAE